MRVAFVGDLGLSSRLIADPESHISPGLVRLLRSCDMAVANLELPIRVKGASTAPYSHPSLAGRIEAWPDPDALAMFTECAVPVGRYLAVGTVHRGAVSSRVLGKWKSLHGPGSVLSPDRYDSVGNNPNFWRK